MSETVTTETETPTVTRVPGQLSITAPDGAHFEWEEVKTDRGQKSLGEVPILVWDDVDKAIAYYGKQGILNVLDGTSFRVSFQGKARTGIAAGKSYDDIAKSQIEFKPGSRQGGQSTPASRAAAAAKKASEKLNGDAITQMLNAIASGKITSEMLAQMGVDVSSLNAPTNGVSSGADEELTDDEETSVDEQV
jgi:hypothetical protein